ncbi:hypothetical protein NUW54_g12402 [Trametes sanguinea]|uniref:Uncharacterized protein n=1 Tax=Trametes sanguinea TaxID=158606 RepID=A0ACC1MYC4_9APHY|nr:hypothetical protein NUW54_g12402 [Trametes sanguinea]
MLREKTMPPANAHKRQTSPGLSLATSICARSPVSASSSPSTHPCPTPRTPLAPWTVATQSLYDAFVSASRQSLGYRQNAA